MIFQNFMLNKPKRDFTLKLLKTLLNNLKNQNYTVTSFEEFIKNSHPRSVILRHDVDAKPHNAITTAILENQLQIKGTYYFRIVRKSNDPEAINKIIDLGHEIGYHYEDLSSSKGDIKKAYQSFLRNLEYFREFYPVKTISMHGSIGSKIDNRKLWDYYDYKVNGIIGEPYLDLNFDKVLYMTDTGRCWNSKKSNFYDKVESRYNFNFSSTEEIISAISHGVLPENLLITIHPERWNDDLYNWGKEFVGQNFRNFGKLVIKSFVRI